MISEATPLMDYPKKQFSSDPGKCNLYLKNIHRILTDGVVELGPFKTMVKSGEVYVTSGTNEHYPFLVDP